MNRLSSFWARVLGPIESSSVGVRTAFGRVTGRCPECKLRKDHHRFGCSRRPGRGQRFSMRGKP